MLLRYAVPATVLVLTLGLSADAGIASRRPDQVVSAVQSLDRGAAWTVTRQFDLTFPTFHPQGLARVGDRLYLSSVEVIEPPVRYPEPVDGYDRTPGRGRGHLFELDLSGRLLRQITLGEGTMYHPGGIDFDGRSLWVPVAEYRPDSRSIVYRVDPRTLRATEAFRYGDHVGGVVRDRKTGRVHGVSWGSRRMFTWTDRGRLLRRGLNESHYVDFQDCAAASDGTAVCTGLTEFPLASGGRFDLGGIAVVDLRTGAIGHEVPVTTLSANRHVVTRNPVHLETAGGVLRMWAAPDDGEEPGGTRLMVLETPID
ncbi:hypothetical protein Acsp03_40810 [Actinomadura sp. NBRC 104412]|uniref:DUF6454 family protein n=1 Tax=Actinomadura sp. NBRC 104412 TaxID=3032203 RepID=UPI0024A28E7D|nr:DUF6454 family protein [Actinomadura sp. NBRC 104412]GLZ06615.1 hypothetical protein Acsp03_40810 [Actinomadura sp. NBRC 104412]